MTAERKTSEGAFDLEGLYQIIEEVTTEFRKGEEVVESQVGGVKRVDVYAMPHESEVPEDLERIDVHFITVGVAKEKAETQKDRFVGILRGYPQPDRLAGGPSYIEVGGVVGSQDVALRMFALGEVLGLWQVITPKTLGLAGEDADRFAGRGLVMMSGFQAK